MGVCVGFFFGSPGSRIGSGLAWVDGQMSEWLDGQRGGLMGRQGDREMGGWWVKRWVDGWMSHD